MGIMHDVTDTSELRKRSLSLNIAMLLTSLGKKGSNFSVVEEIEFFWDTDFILFLPMDAVSSKQRHVLSLQVQASDVSEHREQHASGVSGPSSTNVSQ